MRKKCTSMCFFELVRKKIDQYFFYQKLYSTPPCHGACTCKVSRKYINAFSSYSAKTKRDGQTDGWTDGRGPLQYLPSRAFGFLTGGGGGACGKKMVEKMEIRKCLEDF